MKLLLLAIALLISQSLYAADSTKVKKVEKRVEAVKVEKAEKTDKTNKSQKTDKTDKSDKANKTDKADKATKEEKSKKERKDKSADTVKVTTPPPPPPAPLFTDIIPQPLSLVKGEGRFTIDERTAIICDKMIPQAADYLRIYLPLERSKGKKNNSIRLLIDAKNLGKEEYTLNIDKKGIEICGGDYGGVFNGIQSLLQLLPHAIYTKNASLPMEVSYIAVKDAPEHHYRGFLLDVARTFQSVHEIKRAIDYMAYCKLNKLHFHLVDNPAWRIEIKKYPHFAQLGGFRGGDSPLHPIYSRFNQKYGGYYTQEELRDIVAYAAMRNIEVIPEIDMPGHSKALGTVHPAIRCNYTPDTSYTNGIDTRNVWCVAKESNYALIEDIIKELVEIFPSEYIHIGGDEVKFSLWDPCPDCQRLMKEKGLKDGPQLEQHFLNRVSEILSKYNRKPVVWDEAVKGGLLPKSTLVCGWRHHGKGWQTSIENGYPTIVMPSTFFYLDKRQSTFERGHRSGSGGLDLKKLCEFDFSVGGFSKDKYKHIAGVEGAFWGEIYLMNINPKGHFSDYLEYMIFPRIFAVSEVAWSKQRRSYNDMLGVLRNNFYHKLRAMSATFRLESPTVQVDKGKIFVTVEDGSKLFYRDIRTNRTQELKAPLNASMAPFVSFQSRLMTGYSNWVGAPKFYEPRKVEVKITSSMPFQKKHSAESCAAYKGPAYTTRCAKKGDWVEYRFEKPLKASYIKVATGYEHLHRCLIYKGHIDVSYDGKKFVRLGGFNNGHFTIRPKNKQLIHAIRLVADHISDAEDKVILQPLEIK